MATQVTWGGARRKVRWSLNSQIDFVNDAVTVVNNRTLTVSISTDPTNAPTKGSVVLGADNKSFVYTPTVQGPATDTFVYIATDGTSSKQATVTVNIGSANNAPVISSPAARSAQRGRR